ETYIPTTRGVRRPWAANLKTQVGIEGATLGLDATEITDTQTVLQDYIDSENALDAAKLAVHAASETVKIKRKAMDDEVHTEVNKMKKSGAYTVPIGEQMGIEGATHLVHFENYKPTFRKKNPIFLENNLVHISFIKAGAEAENFYGRQKGESNWVLIGSKIKYTPFIDNRPLADPTKPEHREYKAHGLYGDKEVGLDSDILTIAYGGGTGGNTGGGIVGGNVPPVTG
ncbi:MAG: hypothetical protein ACYDCN_16905, partial [Bacteroidia bacterium]